jgi:hypothetical protein
MPTKICNDCKEVKDSNEFAKNKYDKKDGRKTICKFCNNIRSKKYHNKHKEKINNRQKEYYQANAEKLRRYTREYHQKKSKQCENTRLLYTYGISLDEKLRMIDSQNHQCACCNEELYPTHGNICVDHDHSTGVVRKILCRSCNMALGIMNENPDKITKLLQYSLYCKNLREGT